MLTFIGEKSMLQVVLSTCGNLFIIALETLAIYIRGSDEIKGINIWNEHEIKLIAFADMTTFLKDYQSAEKLLHVLNDFGRCSGLKLNESKLEAC